MTKSKDAKSKKKIKLKTKDEKIGQYELQWLSPNSLKPFDKNPRINGPAIKAVAESIKQSGFNQPIFVNQDYVICAGHTRWMAAKELELEKVPVIVKEMTKVEFMAYNMADNKTHEFALWDDALLAEQMDWLAENEIDMSYLSAEIKRVDELLEEATSQAPAFDESPMSESPKEEKEDNVIPEKTARITIQCPYAIKSEVSAFLELTLADSDFSGVEVLRV